MFGGQGDLPVIVEGLDITVARRKTVTRLAANGQYMDTGEAFVPAQPVPGWTWVFVALNAVISIVSMGGWVNILIEIGGIVLCGVVARSKIKSTGGKAFACVGVTVAAWVAWFALNRIVL